MSGLTTAAAGRVIDAVNATTALTAAVAPEKVRLTSTNPTAAAAGTEISGGSYVAGGQTVAWTATGGANTTSNSGIVTYSSMPAVTVNGIDIFDSAGTPFRWWWASSVSGFTAKSTNAGDTLSFAVAAIVETITS